MFSRWRIIVRTATTLDPNNLLPAPNLYIDGGLSNRGGNGGTEMQRSAGFRPIILRRRYLG